MKSVIINNVPDLAEFHKFWVVKFKSEDVGEYVVSFLEEAEALDYLHEHKEEDLSLHIYTKGAVNGK